MSKLSQLHMELMEQASDLGFESLGEAEQAGYGVDWEKAKLIPPEEAAHEAWIEERDDLCERLRVAAHKRRTLQDYNLANLMAEAHDFIKGQCHD